MKDVFLSHAGPEKEHVVKPFARELRKRGITYWLDEAEILWGDKISKRISEGLKEARFVIVFLSESFVNRNWPETELGAALARENAQGQTIVLPIVVGDPGSVLASYPLLLEKAYLKWDVGVNTLVDQLEKRLAYIGVQAKKEEKEVEKDWRRPLVEILGKYRHAVSPDFAVRLDAICGKALGSGIQYSDVRAGMDELFRDTFRDIQEDMDFLLQNLSAAEEELLEVGKLEFRVDNLCRASAAKIGACCRRESLPIRSEILEFYTDVAKRVERWIGEFFDQRLSIFDLVLWGILRSVPSRVTRKLGHFLSSKIEPLVGDWKAESLGRVIHAVVRKLEPEVDSTLRDLWAGLQENGVVRAANRSGENFASAAPMLENWIEKKVTFRWATLFSDRSTLMVMQALAAGVKGTPQERLRTVLIEEILETGDKQDSSFPEDLADHVIYGFLPIGDAKAVAKQVTSERARHIERRRNEIGDRVAQKREHQQSLSDLVAAIKAFEDAHRSSVARS